MDPVIKRFVDGHRDKMKQAYINWVIDMEMEKKQLSDPRIVIEHLLKTIVIDLYRNFKHPDFITSSIVEKESVLKDFDEKYGGSTCYYFLNKHYPDLIPTKPNNLKAAIENIIELGNNYIHALLQAGPQNMDIIDDQLYHILSWFFIEKEKVVAWEKIYITPEVKRVLGNYGERAAKRLYKELQLNTPSQQKEIKINENGFSITRTSNGLIYCDTSDGLGIGFIQYRDLKDFIKKRASFR